MRREKGEMQGVRLGFAKGEREHQGGLIHPLGRGMNDDSDISGHGRVDGRHATAYE